MHWSIILFLCFLAKIPRARAISDVSREGTKAGRSWKLFHNPHPTDFWDQYTLGYVSHLLKVRKQPVVGFSFQKSSKLLHCCFIFFILCKPGMTVLIISRRHSSLISQLSRCRQARIWIVTNTGIWFCRAEVYPFLAPDLSISIYISHSETCWKMLYILTAELCELRTNGSRNSHLRDIKI